MLSLKYKIISFVVLVLATILNAVPYPGPEEAPTETTVAPAVESVTKPNATILSDQEPEEENAEDMAHGKVLEEVLQNICELLLGECWVLYEQTKPHLDEEHRVMICLKRIRGFGSCAHVTEAQLKQAVEAIEKKKKLEEEKATEEDKKCSEREKQLDKFKEEWNLIRMKARGESPENCTSTAGPDVSENPDMSENPEMSSTLPTDSVEIDT